MVKKRRRKKKKWKIVLITIIALLLISVIGFLVIDSSFFNIKTIEVNDINGDRYTKDEIIEASGIVDKTNIFRAKLEIMENNIESESFIKAAKITKEYPNKLIIEIEERVATSCFIFLGQYLILDSEGYIVEILKENNDLTYIDGFRVVDFIVGEKLLVEEAQEFDDTLSLVKTMVDSDMFFQKITNDKGYITVSIYDKLITTGTVDEIKTNIDSLRGIIYDLYKKGIKRGVIRIRDNGYFSYSPLD